LHAEIEYRVKSAGGGKCGIRSSKGSRDPMSWGVALTWGTVIVRRRLGALAAATVDPKFNVWVNRAPEVPVSRTKKTAS